MVRQSIEVSPENLFTPILLSRNEHWSASGATVTYGTNLKARKRRLQLSLGNSKKVRVVPKLVESPGALSKLNSIFGPGPVLPESSKTPPFSVAAKHGTPCGNGAGNHNRKEIRQTKTILESSGQRKSIMSARPSLREVSEAHRLPVTSTPNRNSSGQLPSAFDNIWGQNFLIPEPDTAIKPLISKARVTDGVGGVSRTGSATASAHDKLDKLKDQPKETPIIKEQILPRPKPFLPTPETTRRKLYLRKQRQSLRLRFPSAKLKRFASAEYQKRISRKIRRKIRLRVPVYFVTHYGKSITFNSYERLSTNDNYAAPKVDSETSPRIDPRQSPKSTSLTKTDTLTTSQIRVDDSVHETNHNQSDLNELSPTQINAENPLSASPTYSSPATNKIQHGPSILTRKDGKYSIKQTYQQLLLQCSHEPDPIDLCRRKPVT